MSNSHLPNTYIKSVLQNGVGRYICQLQRLTLKFCKTSGGSKGLRDFIEHDLLEFTRANPGVVIYLKPRRHHSPVLSAEYLNGRTETVPLGSQPREEVCQWVEHLRTRSGREIMRHRKQQHTDMPSIQGVWTPFTNRDTSWNVNTFPVNHGSSFKFIDHQPTATEELIKLAQQKGLINLVSEDTT